MEKVFRQLIGFVSTSELYVVFGFILTAGLVYNINQNRIIIDDLVAPILATGDKVYFTKPIAGQPLEEQQLRFLRMENMM